jgi:hypothetical protein
LYSAPIDNQDYTLLTMSASKQFNGSDELNGRVREDRVNDEQEDWGGPIFIQD